MIKYYFYKKDGFYYVDKKVLFRTINICTTRDYRTAKRFYDSCLTGVQTKHQAITYCQDKSIQDIYKSCFDTIEIRSI